MNVQIILSQMLMLFAMMVVGYFIWKKKWLSEEANAHLSKIVVNIFNPILVIYGVMDKSSGGTSRLLLQNIGFVIFFYVFMIFFGIVLVLILRPQKSERKIYRLMTLFPNVGFMGIPVITSIFGTESMIYIVFYMLGYNLLLYTYGMVLAAKAAVDGGHEKQGEKQGGQWKRMLNPGVIASVAAVFIFVFQIKMPTAVVTFCDYMGNATIPLSMILIGVSIARADLKTIFTNVRAYIFTALKMVALPIGMILLLKGLPVDRVVFGVFALQLAMPVGSIVTLIVKESGADESCCTNGIVLSTLASIVTIPLVCMFL